MPRYPSILLVAVFLLSACGGTDTSTAPARHKSPTATPSRSTSPDEELVGWGTRFCSLDGSVVTSLPMQPIAPLGSPTERDRQPLLDYLADSVAVLKQAKTSFGRLPAAPTEASAAMLAAYRKNIDKGITRLQAETTTTSKQAADQLGVMYTLDPGEVTLFEAESNHVILTAMKSHPDLKAAFAKAPFCEVYAH